ncbi:hypothetical protein V6N11_013025 [Hibiscus sabdariffa]|uniref:RNase H type-1 domain-containing protein n=1 Tax=Hibiscus sabdariffa TaxID=183260 RepID=A0ABR2NCH8_9ROSI
MMTKPVVSGGCYTTRLGFGSSLSLPIGTGSLMLAELSTVEYVVDMFLKSSWGGTHKLIVEIDCSNVFCWVLNPSKSPMCFSIRFQALSYKFLRFGMRILYVSRACNMEADSLAERAIGDG